MKYKFKLLVVLVLMVTMVFSGVNTVGAPIRGLKMTDRLLSACESMGDEDTVDVLVELYAVDPDLVMDEFGERYPLEYQVYCYAKDDMTFSGDNIDIDILQSAIRIKRAIYAEKNTERNQIIASSYFEGSNILFVSKYSPILIGSITKTGIYALEEENEVVSLDLFVNTKGGPCLSRSNILSRAKLVRDTYGETGANVNIGQLDAGLPLTNEPDLANAIIVTHGSGSIPGMNIHATLVARVLVGSSNGIAPGANLFSTFFTDDLSFYSGVEWLLSEEASVNVINMSAHLGSPNGEYDARCKWVDHIAIEHDVHFVVSAGNRGIVTEDQYIITSPGMAYNVITVGGFYDNNDSEPSNDVRYNASSYLSSAQSIAEKPNIIASAKDIYIGANYSGTSYAAPQVTGVIAQLCGKDPELLVRQSEMGAILSAGAKYKLEGTTPGEAFCAFQNAIRVSGSEQISVFEGAGKLNAKGAYDIVNNSKHWKATVTASNFPYTKTISLSASSTTPTRIAIFWLKRNYETDNHTVTSVPFSNLDLTVKAPNGSVVATSTTQYANYEIVQFYPSQTGTYSIVISKESSNTSTKEYIGIAVYGNT